MSSLESRVGRRFKEDDMSVIFCAYCRIMGDVLGVYSEVHIIRDTRAPEASCVEDIVTCCSVQLEPCPPEWQIV
jgi:hypothetical protein